MSTPSSCASSAPATRTSLSSAPPNAATYTSSPPPPSYLLLPWRLTTSCVHLPAAEDIKAAAVAWTSSIISAQAAPPTHPDHHRTNHQGQMSSPTLVPTTRTVRLQRPGRTALTRTPPNNSHREREREITIDYNNTPTMLYTVHIIRGSSSLILIVN